jgi:hypothetical protein
MIRHMKNTTLRAACLTLLYTFLHLSNAQAATIPEAEITSLQQGTAAQITETSATKKRYEPRTKRGQSEK